MPPIQVQEEVTKMPPSILQGRVSLRLPFRSSVAPNQRLHRVPERNQARAFCSAPGWFTAHASLKLQEEAKSMSILQLQEGAMPRPPSRSRREPDPRHRSRSRRGPTSRLLSRSGRWPISRLFSICRRGSWPCFAPASGGGYAHVPPLTPGKA